VARVCGLSSEGGQKGVHKKTYRRKMFEKKEEARKIGTITITASKEKSTELTHKSISGRKTSLEEDVS